MSTEVATGGNVLLEHLTDPRTHGSYHPAKAPLMHALKGPENESVTFFDWLRNTVSAHVSLQQHATEALPFWLSLTENRYVLWFVCLARAAMPVIDFQ